jgi:hypothetical protein
MGERAFWNGIRAYTRKYFGKSVITADFPGRHAAGNPQRLNSFFKKWVYLTGV